MHIRACTKHRGDVGRPRSASFRPQGQIGMTLRFTICETSVSERCVESRIFSVRNLGGREMVKLSSPTFSSAVGMIAAGACVVC